MVDDKENFSDYRKRVMDPISSSFCAAKWLNATLWLGNGATASCHLPPAHKIPISEIEKDPSALHNTLHKKVMRAQMLKGQRPSECEYCWKIEDLGAQHMSDRVFKTTAFSEEDIRQISTQSPKMNSPLRTLEISFDRTCQFACSYCNAGFSTRWGKEISQFGPYQNLQSDGAGAFQHIGAWAAPFPENENPYVKAFWKWWPSLSSELRELRITGGEPFLSKNTWEVIEKIKNNPKPGLTLAINSNLGFTDSVMNQIIAASQSIPKFEIYTSCDAVGPHAEYIRDGLNYENFKKNVRRLLVEGKVEKLHFMVTAGALSLSSLDQFLLQILEWKTEFPENSISWMLNILRFPSFMSPLVLSRELRVGAAQKLRVVLAKFKGESSVKEFELESLSRLIAYIEEVEKPHFNASEEKVLQKDFGSFFHQYDQRRGKSFVHAFPEWKNWYENLPPAQTKRQDSLIDGDHSAGWHDEAQIRKQAIAEGLLD